MAVQSDAKAQQNPQPQAPPMEPGGARRAPCGFWSALSHRFGRPRAANLGAQASELVLEVGIDPGDPQIPLNVTLSLQLFTEGGLEFKCMV